MILESGACRSGTIEFEVPDIDTDELLSGLIDRIA
jgi:hypothetical protein